MPEETMRVVFEGRDLASDDAKRVKGNLGALDKSAGNLAKTFKRVGIAAGVAAAAVTAASVKMAADFDSSMTKIVTLVGLSDETVNGFRESVLALSGETARAPKELANALFVVTSAGARGAVAMETLEGAAKAAAVGLGDTTSIARSVTSALQAYSDQGLTATRATEILVATVRAGNLEASALAGSLGRVIGIASQVGVSFEDLGAFVATFTRLGVSAEEAVTALRGILSGMIAPTTEAAAALESVGTSFGALRQQITEEGLAKTLSDLVLSFDGNAEAIASIIPNIRALSGVLGTAGAQGEAFDQITKDIAESMGILDEAFERTQQTASFKFQKALNELKLVLVDLGIQLLPAASAAAIQFSEAARVAGEILLVLTGRIDETSGRIRELTLDFMDFSVRIEESVGGALGALTTGVTEFLRTVTLGFAPVEEWTSGLREGQAAIEAHAQSAREEILKLKLGVDSLHPSSQQWFEDSIKIVNALGLVSDTTVATAARLPLLRDRAIELSNALAPHLAGMSERARIQIALLAVGVENLSTEQGRAEVLRLANTMGVLTSLTTLALEQMGRVGAAMRAFETGGLSALVGTLTGAISPAIPELPPLPSVGLGGGGEALGGAVANIEDSFDDAGDAARRFAEAIAENTARFIRDAEAWADAVAENAERAAEEAARVQQVQSRATEQAWRNALASVQDAIRAMRQELEGAFRTLAGLVPGGRGEGLLEGLLGDPTLFANTLTEQLAPALQVLFERGRITTAQMFKLFLSMQQVAEEAEEAAEETERLAQSIERLSTGVLGDLGAAFGLTNETIREVLGSSERWQGVLDALTAGAMERARDGLKLLGFTLEEVDAIMDTLASTTEETAEVTDELAVSLEQLNRSAANAVGGLQRLFDISDEVFQSILDAIPSLGQILDAFTQDQLNAFLLGLFEAGASLEDLITLMQLLEDGAGSASQAVDEAAGAIARSTTRMAEGFAEVTDEIRELRAEMEGIMAAGGGFAGPGFAQGGQDVAFLTTLARTNQAARQRSLAISGFDPLTGIGPSPFSPGGVDRPFGKEGVTQVFHIYNPTFQGDVPAALQALGLSYAVR